VTFTKGEYGVKKSKSPSPQAPSASPSPGIDWNFFEWSFSEMRFFEHLTWYLGEKPFTAKEDESEKHFVTRILDSAVGHFQRNNPLIHLTRGRSQWRDEARRIILSELEESEEEEDESLSV
jgi:hypothetical protein